MVVLFGLTLLPMAIVVGGAIDYASYQADRSELNDATDAAVLGAISKDALGLTTSGAQAVGARIFETRLTSRVNGIVTDKKTTVTEEGEQRTATHTYTARIPTTFLKMIGIDTLQASMSASASATMPIYMDFYLLLDNSPSMGVAATLSGISTMVANTRDGCAFACHDLSSNGNDYYALAKRLGVSMRIDLVRTATQRLMDTAATARQVARQYRMAIYTFGASGTSRQLTTVAGLTSDLAAAKTAAGTIDLMTVPYANHDSDQYTDYDNVFSALNGNIDAPGTGIAPSSTPQKVVFFVSDGVADARYPSGCGGTAVGGGRCQEPIKISNCTALKNRGIRIAVLYTTYLPLPTNGWYMSTVAPWSPQIAANMRSCASPGLYFEVSPSGGISEALDALFKKAVQTARLTR